jgi:hypothetical protein
MRFVQEILAISFAMDTNICSNNSVDKGIELGRRDIQIPSTLADLQTS